MRLDDPRSIEQAMQTHKCEVEVLYWILEDSLYQGNQDKAKSIYTLLLYIAQYRQDLLIQGLKAKQRERLQEIAYELYSKNSIKKRSSIIIKPGIAGHKIPFEKEKDFQDFLCKNPQILAQALEDGIKIMGREVETDFEYRCDIVAESEKFFYPVELKIAQTDHAVVSQIQKYCFYFYRKLRYNHFKEIQGVVLSVGFDNWSINELRRDGIILFQIRPKDKEIKLIRI